MDNELLSKIIDLVISFFKAKALPAIEKAAVKEVSKPVAPIQVQIEPSQPEIDWSNPNARLSANFSVKEALTLNSWHAMHAPSDQEKEAIKGIALKVTKAIYVLARETGKEIHVNVHAWMRPEVANIPGSEWNGKDYNAWIYNNEVWKDLTPEERSKKHVPNSPHKTGHAIDFHVMGYEGKEGCAKIRTILLPHLESLGLRMEDLNGGWVHLDDLPVKVNRFFKP